MSGIMNVKVINCINSWNKYSTFIKRCFCNTLQQGIMIQQLKSRGLVKIKGDEVVPYLQGLITNDMRHLQEKSGSMYTLFLNTKGRVMYDSIIYSTNDPKTYIIECDSTVLNQFQKHLKMFKVKRKIDIDTHPYHVWVLFNNSLAKDITFNEINNESLKTQTKTALKTEQSDKYSVFKDPRVNLLGVRILCEESITEDNIISMLNLTNVTKSADNDHYRKLRYCLGVGEGVCDLPQGTCFPLEANADFLHGVSFHKGCYIGQELTARTHHTGVVRKRLMPLLFEKEIQSDSVVQDSPVFGTENDKTSFGKVRGVVSNVGLGLLRIVQVTQEPILNVSGNKAKTYKPVWWPEEAPKEKASVG